MDDKAYYPTNLMEQLHEDLRQKMSNLDFSSGSWDGIECTVDIAGAQVRLETFQQTNRKMPIRWAGGGVKDPKAIGNYFPSPPSFKDAFPFAKGNLDLRFRGEFQNVVGGSISFNHSLGPHALTVHPITGNDKVSILENQQGVYHIRLPKSPTEDQWKIYAGKWLVVSKSGAKVSLTSLPFHYS